MKNLKYFLFATFIIFTQNSQACMDANLYEDTSSLNKIKIVNQGDMNTCYAHTLATTYNIEFGEEQQDRLHPYWVAFAHKNRTIHWSPKSMNYSILSWAWADMSKKGICSYNETQQRIDKLKAGVNYTDDQLFYLLQTYFKSKFWIGVRTNKGFQKTLKKLEKKLAKSQQFEIAWNRSDLERILFPIRSKSKGKSFFKFLEKHVFNDCQTLSYPEQKVVNFGRGFESNKSVALQVEHLLAMGKPVALGYCPRPIYKGGDKDIDGLPRISRAISTKCGSHYSVLVGSRKKAQSCEYLIRNTYSEKFWASSDSTECYCENRITGVRGNCKRSDSNSSDQKVLGCWFSSKKILDNTFDLSYF